jgi:hypothetical protein
MQNKALTVDHSLEELPPERQVLSLAVVELIRKNLQSLKR